MPYLMPAALHELHQGGRKVLDLLSAEGWPLACQGPLVIQRKPQFLHQKSFQPRQRLLPLRGPAKQGLSYTMTIHHGPSKMYRVVVHVQHRCEDSAFAQYSSRFKVCLNFGVQ